MREILIDTLIMIGMIFAFSHEGFFLIKRKRRWIQEKSKSK
jgi:hypothetical protein